MTEKQEKLSRLLIESARNDDLYAVDNFKDKEGFFNYLSVLYEGLSEACSEKNCDLLLSSLSKKEARNFARCYALLCAVNCSSKLDIAELKEASTLISKQLFNSKSFEAACKNNCISMAIPDFMGELIQLNSDSDEKKNS